MAPELAGLLHLAPAGSGWKAGARQGPAERNGAPVERAARGCPQDPHAKPCGDKREAIGSDGATLSIRRPLPRAPPGNDLKFLKNVPAIPLPSAAWRSSASPS